LLIVGGLFLTGCGATAPVVQSTDGPETLQTGESGTFEASINEDADEPLTYEWDFGDGSSGSGLLTTHAFSEPGEYTVTFMASNEGGSSSESMTVTVNRPPQPARITSINASPNPVDEDESVRFTSNVQGDTPITYEWDFGDGSTASGSSGTHTYSEPGSYTVRLTASNDAGEDSRTRTVTVERVLPPVCMNVTEFNAAFFSYNSSTLTDEGRTALQENLDILSQCPNLDVRIEGFAAPGERNAQSLSDDRARAVAQFYQSNGISSGRLMSMGQGRPEGVTTKKGGTRQYRRADSVPQR
jgi:PKD repeat protein